MSTPLNAYTLNRVLEAALDQPNPSPALTRAIQDVLTARRHPDRDRSRDPRPGVAA